MDHDTIEISTSHLEKAWKTRGEGVVIDIVNIGSYTTNLPIMKSAFTWESTASSHPEITPTRLHEFTGQAFTRDACEIPEANRIRPVNVAQWDIVNNHRNKPMQGLH